MTAHRASKWVQPVCLLVCLALLRPAARAAEAERAPAFPSAFEGMTFRAMAEQPFYAGEVAGALERHTAVLASLTDPSDARAYIEAAAGAPTKAAELKVKRELETSVLPASRAAAVLAAAALAQPAQFAKTMDHLEELKPGLGRTLTDILAKADGRGNRDIVAALRAAGRGRPSGRGLVYGADGRWAAFFDNAPVTRGYAADAGPPAVPLTTYGPDGRLRGGEALAAAGPARGVRVKTADGRFEVLSPEAFEKRFGVRYLPSMPAEAPAALRQAHANFRAAYDGSLGPRPAILADKDVQAQFEAGHAAQVYVARAGESVGFGAFAARAIKAGQLIGEYTGAWRDGVPYAEAKENGYLFEYPAAGRYLVDASREGSAMRFVNHSDKNANARAVFAFRDGYYHILYVATRDIAVDEQVLIDYGGKYWEGRTKPEAL